MANLLDRDFETNVLKALREHVKKDVKKMKEGVKKDVKKMMDK